MKHLHSASTSDYSDKSLFTKTGSETKSAYYINIVHSLLTSVPDLKQSDWLTDDHFYYDALQFSSILTYQILDNIFFT